MNRSNLFDEDSRREVVWFEQEASQVRLVKARILANQTKTGLASAGVRRTGPTGLAPLEIRESALQRDVPDTRTPGCRNMNFTQNRKLLDWTGR